LEVLRRKKKVRKEDSNIENEKDRKTQKRGFLYPGWRVSAFARAVLRTWSQFISSERCVSRFLFDVHKGVGRKRQGKHPGSRALSRNVQKERPRGLRNYFTACKMINILCSEHLVFTCYSETSMFALL
jgi:hypothetical protein